MTTLMLAIGMSLSVSFLCSLLEVCSLSLSLTDIASIAPKSPATATIWKRFKENLEKPIAVILIVNTLAHTIGASVAGAEFNERFGPTWKFQREFILYEVIASLHRSCWLPFWNFPGCLRSTLLFQRHFF